MKSNKIISNYFYNMLYQVMNIIIPILTIPYISRVLGVEGVGTNGYVSSIVIVFTAICTFGMINYGSKSIAYVRNKKDQISNEFWGIWIVQLSASIISIIVFILVFIILDYLNMKLLFVMQIPNLIAALLDISWFFIGIEDIKKVSLRNILVKVIALVLIFLLIKSERDLWLYMLINSASALIGNIYFWIYIRRYIHFSKLKKLKIKTHMKGAFILLIPQLVAQIYTSLDRTIIGGVSNLVEVGYYDQSQKIARIALTIVTSLSIVLMPRIANMYAENDDKNILTFLKKSLNFTIFTSVLIAAGIATISREFVPLFFSNEFLVIIPYMMLSSFIIIFISIGGVFANQYALATEKNKEYLIPLVSGAIINVVLNFILSSKLGALGGVISIIVTEFIIMILRIILVKKYINIKFLFSGTYKYIISGMVSFAISYFISYLQIGNLSIIILKRIVCIVIYLLTLLILYKNKTNLLNVFKEKILNCVR